MSRVAAVDLGTNSTRLLVADVEERPARARSRAGSRSRDSARVSTSAGSAPPRRRRARSQLPRGLPQGARGRSAPSARSASRPVVGARRRERRGVPRRDRVELRLHDAAPVRRGGGGDDDPRRHGRPPHRSTTSWSSTSEAARPSSCCAKDGDVAFSTSLDVGCVRITERFLVSDPPTRPELAAAGAYVRSLLPESRGDAPRSASPARSRHSRRSISATPSTTPSGRTVIDIPLASVEEQLERLAAMTTEERVARSPGSSRVARRSSWPASSSSAR